LFCSGVRHLDDQQQRKVLRYQCVAQVVTGLFLLLLGHVIGKDHLTLVRKGVRASGIVVDYKAEDFRDSNRNFTSTGYMPVVQFLAGDRVIQFKDWMGSGIAGPLRRPVIVLYDPANPSVAMIDRAVMNWVPWAPMMAIGIFLFVVGVRGWSRTTVQT
jgi:hypothetical protein